MRCRRRSGDRGSSNRDEGITMRTSIRRIATVALVVFCLYLVGRAVAEPFTIGDDYRLDWGGPSMVGVLVVHMLPGVASLLILGWMVRRRARSWRG
ncbi:hypothetical protein SAMN05445060_0192 [Williamsia sterculiae]|uniref:Uncharacterized protein n=1 Tax=Williamsia sterculiae TaxID=1344003 RepID=A0A1N7CKF4_9NOCA|nr:hypothetical protein SAMN05445060_0192 [Williamsia sterculiae]